RRLKGRRVLCASPPRRPTWGRRGWLLLRLRKPWACEVLHTRAKDLAARPRRTLWHGRKQPAAGGSMPSSLGRALAQLGDPAIKRVLWRGVLGALAVYLLLAVGTWVLIERTTFFESSWLDRAVHLLGGFAVFILPLFLFPATAGIIIGLFLEDVA